MPLVITDLSGNDQCWVAVGWQSRYYDSAASAALFYEAEALTPLGTSATAAGATGASGSGSNVVRNTDLIASWQAVLSTQLAGGGSHLTNVGSFRVWARTYRPTGNTGAVSVRLGWAEGDFRRRTTNDTVSFAADEREGGFVLVDLGLVHITKAVQGTQRWEGRIEAKSTVTGDEVDIDAVFLFPVGGGYVELSAVQQFETPTSWSARDEFAQTAGALTGKTAPIGGVWAGAGDADDFVVETTGHTLQRTAVSDVDANTGRYAVSGVTAFAAQVVQVDFKTTGGTGGLQTPANQGVLARYTDTNNWLMVCGINQLDRYPPRPVQVFKRVAGTVSTLYNGIGDPTSFGATWYTLRLLVDAAGRWSVWFGPQGSALSLVTQGQDAALATGGALASGKPGIYDAGISSGAITRSYDNFMAFVPTVDAAIFASQSLELRGDRAIREDAAGAYWSPMSKVEGKFLRVPPAGREGRSARFLIKASRNDPRTGFDSGIDDLSGQVTLVPRGLSVPEP